MVKNPGRGIGTEIYNPSEVSLKSCCKTEPELADDFMMMIFIPKLLPEGEVD